MNFSALFYKILALLSLGMTLNVHAQTIDQIHEEINYTDKAFGGNFFIGHGVYNGNISSYFSNPFYVGLNLDYYRNRIVIQFDDFIGFGKTKSIIDYTSEEIWNKNKFALSGMINLSMGFSLIESRKIMMVPVVGIGFNKLAANLDELYDFKNIYKPIIPHLKFGCYVDFRSLKIFKNHQSYNSLDGSYACPRLSFGYLWAIRDTEYPQFYNGNQIYITLGFGGLGKTN